MSPSLNAPPLKISNTTAQNSPREEGKCGQGDYRKMFSFGESSTSVTPLFPQSARRDIATLLERGRVETARIKTESIINEDIHIELLELLELYCEIVFTRFGLIENNKYACD